jgi:DNA polymerase I-like protein with 3'-5' exonuclease and polymerase domains
MLKIHMAELGPVVDYFNRSTANTVLWLLQVHDELIFECEKSVAPEFAAWGRETMRTAILLGDVPVDSSADMAERWGDLK